MCMYMCVCICWDIHEQIDMWLRSSISILIYEYLSIYLSIYLSLSEAIPMNSGQKGIRNPLRSSQGPRGLVEWTANKCPTNLK